MLVVVRIGLAAVLAVAGVAKLADREGAARAARDFGLGRALRRIGELEAGVEQPAALTAGDEAPGFALLRLGGGEATLDELLEPERSLLLVFVDPGCGPCHSLLPELAGWIGDRVAPVF